MAEHYYVNKENFESWIKKLNIENSYLNILHKAILKCLEDKSDLQFDLDNHNLINLLYQLGIHNTLYIK